MNMTTEEITEHFGALGLVVPVERELWDPTADRDHAPYGYMPSGLLPSGDPMSFGRVLRICPELITAHTEGEDETVTRWYLNSLVIHLKMHVSHIEMPIDELEDSIEHVLRMLDPDAYEAIRRVRARAQ